MGLICSPAQKPSGSPSKPCPGLNLHILGVARTANANWAWSPSSFHPERAVGSRGTEAHPGSWAACLPRAAVVEFLSLGAPTGPTEGLEAGAGILEPPRPWPAGKPKEPPTGKKPPRLPAHGGSKMTDRKKAVTLRDGTSQDPRRQNPDIHPDPTRSLSLSFPIWTLRERASATTLLSAPVAPPAGMKPAVTASGERALPTAPRDNTTGSTPGP